MGGVPKGRGYLPSPGGRWSEGPDEGNAATQFVLRAFSLAAPHQSATLTASPKGSHRLRAGRRPYLPEWFASARARMLADSGKTSSPKRKRYRWFAFWFFTYPWLPQIAQYQPPENRRIPEKTFQNMRIPLANSQTKVYIIHMAYFALRSTVFPRKEFVSCSALGTGSLTLCTAQV